MKFLYFLQSGNLLRILRVELPELPTIAHSNRLLERLLQREMGVLLTLHLKTCLLVVLPTKDAAQPLLTERSEWI